MHKHRKKLFWIVTIIFWLVVIEGGLQLAERLFSHEAPATSPETPSISDETQEADQQTFEQYIGWQSKEFQGQYVHVDSQGVRKTWNPLHKPNEKFRTLYMFGGSTTWGDDVKDEETIPSFLSKILNENSHPLEVHNFGEHGFTFTQELVRLVTLLREGHRPNLVIFYDGYNDAYTAYKYGKAGINYNTPEIREKLTREEPSPSQHLWLGLKGVKENFEEKSLMAQSLAKILRKVFNPLKASGKKRARWDQKAIVLLAKDVEVNYMKSLLFLDGLSKTFGFQYFCFWQPVLYNEETMTDKEAKILETDLKVINENSVKELFLQTDSLMKVQKDFPFFNLQNALAKRKESYYNDVCHLTEKGNEVVANAIFEIIK